MKKGSQNSILRTIIWLLVILIWTAASIIASQFIVGICLTAVLRGTDFGSQPIATAIYSALSYILAMLLIILVPPLLKKIWAKRDKPSKTEQENRSILSHDELGLHGLPTWTDIGLAPIGYLVYMILATILVCIFSNFTWFDISQTQDVGFNGYLSSSDRIIAFVTLVVVAPIAEETIFRGWLYGKIRERLSSVTTNIASIFISAFLISVLFGVIHMQWNVGVNVFALSLVLCALREITGTIYSGILLHMLKNGIAFYMLYVIGIS